MTDARSPDRRDRPRFELVGPSWGTLTTSGQLDIVDIGRGGALVAAPVPLAPEQTRRMRLVLGGHVGEVSVRVRHVRATRELDSAAPYALGLEFLELPPAMRDQIDRLVAAGGEPAEGERR